MAKRQCRILLATSAPCFQASKHEAYGKPVQARVPSVSDPGASACLDPLFIVLVSVPCSLCRSSPQQIWETFSFGDPRHARLG